MNVQPSEAEAGFDLRLPPTADPDAVRRRIAEEWAPSWRNMSFEVNNMIFVFLATGVQKLWVFPGMFLSCIAALI